MASYPSATKSFTAKTDGPGQTIFAAHVNELQDEVVAIENGLRAGLNHDLLFLDATYDIGKSGATRPRDGFFSRNLNVAGSLAVGNAGVFGGNLTFSSDAAYDIGASGATRPRDGFFSRNVVVGASMNVGNLIIPAVPSAWLTLPSTAYTPTWGNTGTANTTTNSTIVGAYFAFGKYIVYRIVLTWGAATASGNGSWTFTLPVTADGTGTMGNAKGIAFDSSATQYFIVSSIFTTTTQLFPVSNASPVAGLTVAVPFTWATGDTLTMNGWYIAA